MITLGNDVSHWNGIIDYSVYKNNSQFIIIKATEGTSGVDSAFKMNQEKARSASVLCGYYHFARPDAGNKAEAEANFFLNTIGPLKDGEFLALDYECPDEKQSHVDWCKDFLDTVLSKTGIKCFVYLNQSNVSIFDWSLVSNAGYALWIAAYTYDPYKNSFKTGKFGAAAMQQWTNKQSVPGCPGVIDGNVFFGSLESLKKYGYKAPVVPTPEPQPTPIPIPDAGSKKELAMNAVKKINDGITELVNILLSE